MKGPRSSASLRSRIAHKVARVRRSFRRRSSRSRSRNRSPFCSPRSRAETEFVESLRALDPDISVVVAYGHILPREVIDLPRLGTLNIHASLLPEWRGAAPIQAAIRACQTETGVTIMRMVSALDAGPILFQTPTPIVHDETYGELQLRLSELGALALIEALSLLDLGQIVEQSAG